MFGNMVIFHKIPDNRVQKYCYESQKSNACGTISIVSSFFNPISGVNWLIIVILEQIQGFENIFYLERF